MKNYWLWYWLFAVLAIFGLIFLTSCGTVTPVSTFPAVFPTNSIGWLQAQVEATWATNGGNFTCTTCNGFWATNAFQHVEQLCASDVWATNKAWVIQPAAWFASTNALPPWFPSRNASNDLAAAWFVQDEFSTAIIQYEQATGTGFYPMIGDY